MSGSVLIADSSRVRARRIREACSTRGFATTLVPNGAEALEAALADVPAVVVAPVDLELIDGAKLAEILRANPRTQDVRFLLLGRIAAGAPEAAHVDEVLSSATEADEIALRVEVMLAQRARIETAWEQTEADHEVQGRLAQIPLTDLLQLFHLNHRTGTIEVSRREPGGREERGTIWVQDGNVSQAVVGRVDGEKGLFRLLAWQDGSFAFTPGASEGEPRIVTPTRALLMEGLRQIDEWDRMRSSLPPLDSEVVLKVATGEIPNVVHPLTQEVLMLLELHRTVHDVVDHCSHPDYQVLRTLQTLVERDLVTIRHAPPAPLRRSAEEIFSATQARRLRDWLQGSRQRGQVPRDAKLLLISPSVEATRDFVRLLTGLPGMQIEEPFRAGKARGHDLLPMGYLAVDGDHSLEFVHVPADESFAPLWPVAAHGALGALVLLANPIEESEERLHGVLHCLRDVPRARIFHTLLLRKGEKLGPEEVQERMALLDDASLFLLPLEGASDPVALLRAMLGRVIP